MKYSLWVTWNKILMVGLGQFHHLLVTWHQLTAWLLFKVCSLFTVP
jgi:hypothetical protein